MSIRPKSATTLRRARSSDLRLFRGRSREEHLPAALRPDDSGELFADQPLRMAVRNHPFCQFEQRYADDRRQAGYLLGRSVQTRRQHDQSHGCRCTAVQLQIGFALRYRDLCRGFAGARLSGQAYRCRLYRSLFGQPPLGESRRVRQRRVFAEQYRSRSLRLLVRTDLRPFRPRDDHPEQCAAERLRILGGIGRRDLRV